MGTPRRNIGLWIGLGAAGLIGYGVTRLMLGTRRKKQPEEKTRQPELDRPLGMIACPGCGQMMKEYEFFCPYCGRPREEK